MIALGDFLDVMTAFHANVVSAEAFIDRFFALRDRLVQEQDETIRRDPVVSMRLQQLRDLHGSGAMTSDDYLEAVQAEYGRLEGLPLPPGSEAVRLIDQLYVEADAYREPAGDVGAPSLSEDDLREAVARTLQQLRSA